MSLSLCSVCPTALTKKGPGVCQMSLLMEHYSSLFWKCCFLTCRASVVPLQGDHGWITSNLLVEVVVLLLLVCVRACVDANL